MVKVVNKIEYEKRQKEKYSKLVEITEKIIGENKYICDSDLKSISIKNKIDISSISNILIVRDNVYFDIAMKLAKEYEKATHEEFIIGEEY